MPKTLQITLGVKFAWWVGPWILVMSGLVKRFPVLTERVVDVATKGVRTEVVN